MQTPTQNVFNLGASYTITMYHSIYAFGQAEKVELYDNDVFIANLGSWIYFSNNTKAISLPTSIPSSNCYNIRVAKGSELYISRTFTIVQ